MRKKLISWVRPGVALVFTRRLRFTRVLIREDLPTLERPVKAISGKTASGYWAGVTALLTNSADFMIIYGFSNIKFNIVGRWSFLSIKMLCFMQVKQINHVALACQRDEISRYARVTAENIM